MRFLSVCSGIEAASVAWGPLGWKAVAFSEIDKFPCSVLAHHYRDVPNLGDMTKFEEWPIEPGSIDVLVGGTPCQSFSLAGLRGGIEDDRGNLSLVYCRILQKFRPRWFVWENVPGVLSSSGGRDFGSILGAMVELGYGVSYRVLNAEFFGVPQRRRRVYVVGHLGNWQCCARALFDPQSLQRNSKKGRGKREKVVGAIGARTCRSVGSQDAQCGHIVPALTGWQYADRGDTGDKLVFNSVFASTGDVSHCLNAGGMGRQDYETETMVVTGALSADDGEQGFTTIQAACSGMLQSGPQIDGVRRLTPRECERLQGFQDDYTLVPHRGKPAANGPRYKALGNSMAIPVMSWIGQRIQMVEEELKRSNESMAPCV